MSSYILRNPLKPEPLYLTISLWMLQELRRSVEGWLYAFWLSCFTTNGAQTHILVWTAEYRMTRQTPTSYYG